MLFIRISNDGCILDDAEYSQRPASGLLFYCLHVLKVGESREPQKLFLEQVHPGRAGCPHHCWLSWGGREPEREWMPRKVIQLPRIRRYPLFRLRKKEILKISLADWRFAGPLAWKVNTKTLSHHFPFQYKTTSCIFAHWHVYLGRMTPLHSRSCGIACTLLCIPATILEVTTKQTYIVIVIVYIIPNRGGRILMCATTGNRLS